MTPAERQLLTAIGRYLVDDPDTDWKATYRIQEALKAVEAEDARPFVPFTPTPDRFDQFPANPPADTPQL